ncbi:MAG: hypothetical protein ACJA2S_003105 [Cyclobacteriaceae bacterium]
MYRYISCFLLLITAGSLQSIARQNSNELERQIINWLIDQGFENVQVTDEPKNTTISWENRIYRYETRALAEILQNCPMPQMGDVTLIPKYLNTPMVTVKVPAKSIELFRNNSIDYEDLNSQMDFAFQKIKLSNSGISNSSLYKVDLSLEPQLRLQLGNFNNPVKSMIIIAPTVQMQLHKGLLLTGQAVVALQNNFNSDNRITLGLTTLTKNLRLQHNTFISVSAGYFTKRRMGLLTEISHYLFNGKFRVNGQLGHTTQSNLSGEIIEKFLEEQNYTMARVNFDYLIEQYNLFVKVGLGTYLYQDKGIKLELMRQFGEVRVGLHGSLNEFENNAGFNFSLPLIPSRYSKIRHARIRTARHFNWQYNFRRKKAGTLYKSSENINFKSTEFNPILIRNQLLDYFNSQSHLSKIH